MKLSVEDRGNAWLLRELSSKIQRSLSLMKATSALDSKTEQEVQIAIKNLTMNKSTLIIADRLSTIIHADQIIYLEHGKIVDMEPHKELLERCVGYQELVKLQANGLLVE